jgi:hypothetical protein
MKRIILGIVLATIACYFFGFLYWGLNPLPYTSWKHTSNDEAAGQALLEHFPESGTYYIPGMHHDEATLSRLHEAGPLAFVHITREGKPVMQSDVMAKGFLLTLVTTVLIALLLKLAAPALPSYGAVLKFTALAGLTATVMIDFGDSVWWHISWGWKLHMAAYHIVSWIIAGLVLAKFTCVGASSRSR